MSQDQPRRQPADQEPVRYGDIFQVSCELAPKDAATAQAAETIALGQTQKGGPAAVMQSAADVNVRRGVLGRDDATEATRQHGVSISESDVGGQRVITEAVGGEVVGSFVVAGQEETPAPPLSALSPGPMTIGHALESVALSAAGDKRWMKLTPPQYRPSGTGHDQVIPGGVASEGQSAAKHNARTMDEGKKITLRDILGVNRPTL